MQRILSYRYRVYPSVAQQSRLAAWESSLRFLWNLAHEQRLLGLSRQQAEHRRYTAFDQISQLTELRSELPWLADVPRNVCAQVLVQLDRAWQRCFQKLAGRPRFKRRGIGACEPHPKIWNLTGSVLRFPKLGAVRAVVHRKLEGKRKTCTLRRDGDQWFASIAVEVDVPVPAMRQGPVVALDRGVTNVVADSNGALVPAPRFYNHTLNRLAHAQRAVCRRKKGSKNREKAKARVMRLHRKVRRQREHFIHSLSAAYAKSHGTVVVEKLHVRNMLRAGGGLARSIVDAGWGNLVEYLRYKLAWSGGQLVEVPAQYSSQTCNACGGVDRKSRTSQSLFWCTNCGMFAHADVNAAKVLKSRANRSALPVEGTAPKAALRSRKAKVALRVPRRVPMQDSGTSGS